MDRGDVKNASIVWQGPGRAQLGNFERGGGRTYIYNGKNEIIHGLSDSVKSVAILFSGMFSAKV